VNSLSNKLSHFMSLGKVIKSISDKRIYRPLCLKNNL